MQQSLSAEHLKCLFAGLLFAVLWTSAGCLISYYAGDTRIFLDEWRRVQVFPCLALATWLLLLSRSGIFPDRLRRLVQDGFSPPTGLADRRMRVLITITICLLAAATSIGMGFNAKGPTLAFFWATATLSGLIAGFVMVHTIHMIVTIHQLREAKIKTFTYSPAQTPQLREVVSYFATFSLILSIAYLFAFIGTMNGLWTGNPQYIHGVQLFWPVVYVPVCSVALLYPHLSVHWLIQDQKERILLPYQREIDNLLSEQQDLKSDDVQRVNALAQFFDRMNSTPDYVVDLGLAVKTAMPLFLNLAILFAKNLLGQT
jgi:hypothetical protein